MTDINILILCKDSNHQKELKNWIKEHTFEDEYIENGNILFIDRTKVEIRFLSINEYDKILKYKPNYWYSEGLFIRNKEEASRASECFSYLDSIKCKQLEFLLYILQLIERREVRKVC